MNQTVLAGIIFVGMYLVIVSEKIHRTIAAMLGAVLDFLASHEPDLLAAAEALGIEPAELVSARTRL